MKPENSSRNEGFSSDLIDLGDVGLTAVGSLPNAVLRAAIERVQAELADAAEPVAFFQNSMQDPSRTEKPPGKHQN